VLLKSARGKCKAGAGIITDYVSQQLSDTEKEIV
jgi:hypothetical protein